MSALKERALEDYIANNLSRLFPNLNFVSRNGKFADRGFDIHAKDSNGVDYFIMIKNSACNRLNLGQIVEYKANWAKKAPNAKIILICKNVDASLKDLVKKIGVDIWTFSDLGIIESKIADVKEEKEISRLSPVEQKAYFALLKHGSVIARAEDLSLAIGVSQAWAKNILSKLAKNGAAQRIGRGKYAVIPADVLYARKSYVADPLVLLGDLLKGTEYYVAYYSAANVHGLTEQMPFKTTVAVLKQMRPIRAGNVSINFVNLKKSRFFGFEEIRYLDAAVKVSDLEKTIVDCVDRPELCGGVPEVARIMSNAFEIENMSLQKLVSYVKKFGSHAVAQRVGYLLEYLQEKQKMQVEQELIEELLGSIGSKPLLLDAKSSKKGEIVKKWKIINNADYLEV